MQGVAENEKEKTKEGCKVQHIVREVKFSVATATTEIKVRENFVLRMKKMRVKKSRKQKT